MMGTINRWFQKHRDTMSRCVDIWNVFLSGVLVGSVFFIGSFPLDVVEETLQVIFRFDGVRVTPLSVLLTTMAILWVGAMYRLFGISVRWVDKIDDARRKVNSD